MKRLIIAIFVCLLSIPFSTAKAAEFNPNNILSDHELTDYLSMSKDAIQSFLGAKNSFLATYRAPNYLGVIMDAAQMIYNAAQEYKINPKYILTLIQKEQSLVEWDIPNNPSASRLDWATGYAVCDNCNKNDPEIQKYKGFGKQIDAGAGANRFYINNPNNFGVRVGLTTKIDDTNVTPANQATANQYIYTPHIHGNENLWKIWNRWWTRKYPNGVVLKAKEGDKMWLIRDDARHLYSSMAVFLSRHNLNEVIEVDESELQNYEIGVPVKFSNYSLVQSGRGMKFLLVDDTKRPFLTEKVFKQLGYHPDEVIEATDEELKEYKNGKFISELDMFPMGAVVRSPVSGDLYYVHNGEKAVIMSESILKNRLQKQSIIDIAADELQVFKLVKPLKFKDGSLVKGEHENTVYVISDGMKLPIPSEETFLGMGWKWENVQLVDRLSLTIHPTGPMVELNTGN